MKRIINKVALIGSTSKKEKYGYIILKDLINKGYEVFPVHPTLKKIEEIEVCNDVEDLDENIDMYIFVVPWQSGLNTLKKLIETGKERFWFQPGAWNPVIGEYLKNFNNIKYNHDECIMIRSKKVGDLEF